MLERLLFKKVELWVVFVILLLGLVGTLLFAMAVADLMIGKNRFGPLAPAVRQVVSAHSTVAELVKETRSPGRALLARNQRHAEAAGFDFAYDAGTRPEAPYLLVNRFDRDRLKSVSELVDLDAQTVVHSWVYDPDPIWQDSTLDTPLVDLAVDRATARFRGTHALVEPDGEVVVHGMGSPLLKFDLCGDLLWQQDEVVYHHSIEVDAEGNYWVPAQLIPKTVDLGGADFMDDGIVQVSPEGEILSSRSVIGILDDNGLSHLIYGHGWEQADPIHLNDIQPVMEDGPIWQAGDLFLSVRNRSLVLLYRPATDEIVWHQAGPWIHQHDIDILDDRRISVFDNAARLISTEAPSCPAWRDTDPCLDTPERNRRTVVDLVDGTVSDTYAAAFTANQIVTHKQGLQEISPDGTLFVEETNLGRMLAATEDGTVAWSYVNRAETDGRVYTLNWSRLVDRATGDAVRARLDGGTCDG